MNINNLEKRMKAVFGKEKQAIDTDDLWESLQKDLPPNNKGGFRFKWLQLLPVVLLFGLLGMMMTKSDSTHNEVVTIELSQNELINWKAENSREEKSSIVSSDSNNTSHNEEVLNEVEIEKRTVLTKLGSQSKSRKLNSSQNENKELVAQNTAKSVSETKSLYKTQETNFSSFSNSLALDEGQNVNLTEKDNSKERSEQKYHANYNSATSLSLNSGAGGYERIERNEGMSKNTSFLPSTSFIGREKVTHLKESLSSHYEFDNSLLTTFDINTLELDRADLNEPSSSPQRPFWIKKDRVLYFDLGLSFLAGHGNLSVNNVDLSSHFNRRNSAESSLISYAIDATLGYQISDFVSVNTGLILSKYFKSSTAEIITVEDIIIQDGIIQEIIGKNGTQQIRGEVTGVRQTINSVKRINQYSYIHIPVGIDYSPSLGVLDLHIRAGACIGMKASYSGFIHPNNEMEYDLKEDSEEYFKQSAPHFVTVGAGVSYPFSNIFSLSLALNYQYQLGSINNNTYGITENLSGMGLRTGIRIKI